MKFSEKAPAWENAGVEPKEDLKQSGFTAGYKPPAAYFNWFFHQTYLCLMELQTSFLEITKDEIDLLDSLEAGAGGEITITGEPISDNEINEIDDMKLEELMAEPITVEEIRAILTL